MYSGGMLKHTDFLLLRRALLGNAVFSTLTGLTLLTVAEPLGTVFGVPPIALRVIGLGLLPFAVGLIRSATRERVERFEAWLAVVLDLAWVAGSALLVLGEIWPLRAAGTWAVVVVANVVLVFALLQALGLKRSARATSLAASPEVP